MPAISATAASHSARAAQWVGTRPAPLEVLPKMRRVDRLAEPIGDRVVDGATIWWSACGLGMHKGRGAPHEGWVPAGAFVRGSVLLVMPDDAQRAAVVRALADRALVAYEASDTAHGMAALGRADFAAVVCTETRPLSLRGFCLLARKRHPSVPILVVLSPTRDPALPPPNAGVGDRWVDWRIPPVALANEVFVAINRPADTPFDVPNTTMVWDTLEQAADEQRGGPAPTAPAPAPLAVTAPAPAPPPTPVHSPAAAAPPSSEFLLMGELEELGGPVVLTTILAQELTGVLNVQGGAAEGPLYFYRGDPVWAEDPMGDTGLFVRMVQGGILPPRTRRPEVAEGGLLNALVQARLLRADVAQNILVHLVKERVLALASQRMGTYRFREERGFLDVVPLLKVNSFGMILEAQRRNLTPTRLTELGVHLAPRCVVPGPALEAAASRIRPFVRNQDLYQLLSVPMTVEGLWTLLGLDALMGSLLVMSLLEARLIHLRQHMPAPAPTPTLRLAAVAPPAAEDFFHLPDTEVADPNVVLSQAHEQAREEIVGLYMQLKPMVSPRQILGVGLGADPQAVRAAWEQWRARLDPSRVPPGPAYDLLVSHLDELRRKVDGAFAMLSPASGSGSGPRIQSTVVVNNRRDPRG